MCDLARRGKAGRDVKAMMRVLLSASGPALVSSSPATRRVNRTRSESLVSADWKESREP